MKKCLYCRICNPILKVQNDMKRNILILFVLCLVHLNLVAQSIVAEPAIMEETFEVNLADFNDLVIHSSMVNNSDATVDVKWVRVINEELPSRWTSQICDNTTCYASQVSSNVSPDLGLNTPITLAPGEVGTLDIHINPDGTAGSGTITIELYDNADMSTLISTGTFSFNVQQTEVSISEVEKAALQLYPNPSPDYFQLTNASIVDHVVMYNIVGRVVKTFDVYSGERYDIADLPNGMYLVSMINEEEGVVKTTRLSKRAYRP